MEEYQGDVEVSIQLADCRNFKWMCGMKTVCGARIKKGWMLEKWIHKDPEYPPVPDINDPATIGCLYFLLRKTYKDPGAYVHKNDEGWKVVLSEESVSEFRHTTESDALAWAIVNYRK